MITHLQGILEEFGQFYKEVIAANIFPLCQQDHGSVRTLWHQQACGKALGCGKGAKRERKRILLTSGKIEVETVYSHTARRKFYE
jgi:hypothetical protein